MTRLFTILLALALTAEAQTWNISTSAGGALPVNLPGTAASLYGPQSAIAVDASGNVFFADGNTILRLDANSGLLTLVAGNGTQGYTGDNGPAVAAQLHNPYGLAFDPAGNLYIACAFDHVIRKVSNGAITTVAGTGTAGFSGDNGPAAAAQLNSPYGIAFDASGNLYIADVGNNRIREVSGGVITTVAGNGFAGFGGDNGPASNAQINSPHALAVDSSGNLYIADCGNNRVREVSGGIIGTVAGNGAPGYSGDNGPAISAQLNSACGLTLDTSGNLYIADYYNNRVRKVSNGVITTVAGKGTPGFSGDNGPATAARLNEPFAIAADSTGNLYVADFGNDRIRKISGGNIATVAGSGVVGFSGDGGSAVSAQLHLPAGIAVDSSGNQYIADYANNRIRQVSVGGIVSTVAGNGTAGFAGDAGQAAAAQLNQPSGVAADAAGNLYIADTGNSRIRKVSAGGVISTLAGNGTAGFAGDNGPAAAAELNRPTGVALDASGNLYVADSLNNRVRKIAGTNITTVAGNGAFGSGGDGGSAIAAQLNNPTGVAVDSSGNLYIADSGNNRIRKVTGTNISTLAGTGGAGFSGDGAAAAAAQLNQPAGVAVASGGSVYIADTANNAIRRVAGGNITTIAGGGPSLGDGASATSAELGAPQSVALDATGDIYIADSADNRIRELTPVPLSITGPSSLPPATIGTVYTAVSFTAIGSAGGYTWSAANVPKGLTVSTAGVLTGTPTVPGTTSIQIAVKDSAGATANATLSLTVANPTPLIASLAPAAATATGAAFTLTVNGAGFLAGAVVQWNGAPLTTKVVNATQLTASVTAAMIASAANINVTVVSGGNTSEVSTFTVNPLPLPVISDLNPASAMAQGAAFTLTVNGSNFLAGSVVQWNGTALTTKVVSPTQLTASVAASQIANAGTTSIVVVTAGGSSAAFTFTVNPLPLPVISTLNPASATAQDPALTLTVNGTNFIAGSVVQWNGTPLTTKVVSPTQLTASVAAALLTNAGSPPVVVVTAAGSSTSVPFTINALPLPVISTLSPASATAEAAAFTLTINGSNFIAGSVVQWAGTPLTTKVVSATQLTASVPATLIASAGSPAITVVSAAGASVASNFTVNPLPLPTIASLSPASAIAYSAAFTLTVNGTNFLPGAAVQWNSSPLTTKVVSATQLTASVPAAMVTGAGSVTVIVATDGGSSSPATFTINPQPPTIATIAPASSIATGAAFNLTVNGTGFTQSATVQWNGTALPTNFVAANQLTAYVATSLIATPGTATVAVSAGSATTSTLNFTIATPPAITTFSPASVVAGSGGFTLTVNGTGFAQAAAVQWNGNPLATTFMSATQLTAAVSTSLIANAASITIQVSEGGASSAGTTFPVNGPPAISTFSPAAATAGGPAFTLTVNGTGFVSTSVVQWNGTPLNTKFVGVTQLTATVTVSLISSAGSASIGVTAGGVASATAAFTINPPPAIASLSPATVVANGAAFTLTVNGTGFVSGVVVQWNQTALTTTFVSATQVTAAVPANTAATAGSANITVLSGTVSSSSVKLTLTASPPAITTGGVVPIYSTSNVIQPGSWISIYGTGLATGNFTWTGNFPTSLGGTSVSIDGKSAYLWSVSPTQINLQAPGDTNTGPVNVVVTTSLGTSTSTVTLAAYGPSFSLLPASSYAAGVILTPGGTGAYGGGTYDLAGPSGQFSFNTRPVQAGENLALFGVGFGPTSPAVPAGKAYTGAAATMNPVTVTIGGVNARVLFSGLTAAGVYQINVVVPAVSSGDQILLASVGGVQTPAGVLITVQ